MAQENVATLPQRSAQEDFETVVEGMIEGHDQPPKSEWQYLTMRTKPEDDYKPSRIISISQPAGGRPFGRIGEVVRCRVKVGGYKRRTNDYTITCNTLTFIELA